MATLDSELDAPPRPTAPLPSRVTCSAGSDEPSVETLEPLASVETGLPLSQVALPSTEVSGSPIDTNCSFRTEINDDRPADTVIPSSLTPPPSTQVALNDEANPGRSFAHSQRSVLFSPPATILNLNTMRERDGGSDYVPPAPRQVLEASADELRAMLQTCIAEHQKLKMEAAHHKLQFNLLSLQADEESKRAAVEHDMVRRQVDALRMAEHSRQARRELSGPSETTLQSKYVQMKMWYEAAVEEKEKLQRRVKLAKKVIQQKEEETMSLVEEREMLLNRIRENREHFHMLCSPGGIFHGALTPKQQQRTTTAVPRTLRREESDGGREHEHGLSALLEAMNQSQDHSNNSAPTTPMVMARPVARLTGRHQRNAQSMSSLPTTPRNRPSNADDGGDRGGLLPSVNLVARTEPRLRYPPRRYVPSTPPLRRNSSRRKSRESTISAEDNEELARQAVESVKAVQSLAARAALQLEQQARHHQDGSQQQEDHGGDEAYEVLRRQAHRGLEMVDASASGVDERLSSSGGRKHQREEGSEASPTKRVRAEGPGKSPRVGLGIQYKG